MKPYIHITSLLWAYAVLATPSLSSLSSSAPSPSVSTLFALPGTEPSWLENLAIRPSQDTILATRLDAPQLWSINVSTGTGTLLGNASSTALVGITQLLPSSSEEDQKQDEIYYIAGVNYTATGVQPNSSVLYSLTYNHHRSNSSSQSSSSSPSYTFQKALSLPQMTLINGLTAWSSTTLLAADSYQGAIYKIDITTGNVAVSLQDPTMSTNSSSAGINGVKIRRSSSSPQHSLSSDEETATYLYYTNTDQALVARIPVDPETTEPILTRTNTTAEIFASENELLGAPDDFALLDDGSVVVATGAANTVVHVSLDGTVTTIAGSKGSLELASSTACQIGRDGVLYVTTAGGEEGLVNGTLYGAGSVVTVDFGTGWMR